MVTVEVRQWRLFGPDSALADRRRVTLHNDTNGRSVIYGERGFGINLEWSSLAALANAWFEPPPGRGEIVSGEPVALAIEGTTSGPYVRFEPRDNGIDLVWSQRPIFEWELIGPTRGAPVRIDEPIAVFNRTHGDHMVYAETGRGINLSWWWVTQAFTRDGFGTSIPRPYGPLPMPPSMRGPSGEPGQVQVAGAASRINVFHGRVDDELDWHVHLALDPDVRRNLARHLDQHFLGHSVDEAELDDFYCEWMVMDGWANSLSDEKFFSADLTNTLMLRRSAWDVSVDAANDQGTSKDAASDLVARNARVMLQGPLVNDANHGVQIEIHPLDSLAYAWIPDASGRPVPLSIPPTDPDWPATELTWRVAAFTNSSFHRVNKQAFVAKDRTTTWLLPLPGEAASGGAGVDITVTMARFENRGHDRPDLDDRRPTAAATYANQGVSANDFAIETAVIDGLARPHLRVTVTMAAPTDRWGGMFMADYRLVTRAKSGRTTRIISATMMRS